MGDMGDGGVLAIGGMRAVRGRLCGYLPSSRLCGYLPSSRLCGYLPSSRLCGYLPATVLPF
jgi:hypothetical protein